MQSNISHVVAMCVCAAVLVALAVFLSGVSKNPYVAGVLNSSSQAAGMALAAAQGYPSYGGYPQPLTCWQSNNQYGDPFGYGYCPDGAYAPYVNQSWMITGFLSAYRSSPGVSGGGVTRLLQTQSYTYQVAIPYYLEPVWVDGEGYFCFNVYNERTSCGPFYTYEQRVAYNYANTNSTGSLTVPSGTPVTLEWICQPHQQRVFKSGATSGSTGYYYTATYYYSQNASASSGFSSSGSNNSSVTVTPTQTTTYTLTCGSGSGAGAPNNAYTPPSISVTVNVQPPAPTVTLTAGGQYPNLYIPSGGSYTLAYSSSNATSCTLSYGPNGGAQAGSNPISPNTSGSPSSGYVGWYTLTCTGTGGTTAKTVTIQNLPTVTISASDPNAGEPSDTGTFSITRTGATTASLRVSLALNAGSTATLASDYTLSTTSNLVTIPVGASSVAVTVTPVDDTAAESAESVILGIAANASLYSVGSPSSATVNITDNDGDICNDIPGNQPGPTAPAGCTGPQPDQCVPTGWAWNGSTACVIAPPTVSSFSVTPTRVRKGNASAVSWNVSNIASGTSCSITSNPSGIFSATWSGAGSTWTGTSQATNAVTSATRLTLACTNSAGTATRTADIGIIPAFQEI